MENVSNWTLYLADLLFSVRIVCAFLALDSFASILILRKALLEAFVYEKEIRTEVCKKVAFEYIPRVIVCGVIAFLIPSRETILSFLV